MTKQVRAYKYRLYPTIQQRQFLAEWFGATRFIYNNLLEQNDKEHKDWFKQQCDEWISSHGTMDGFKKPRYDKQISKYTFQYRLPQLVKDNEWLDVLPAHTKQFVTHNLYSAFKNFFKGQGKYPSFHSRRGRNSFSENTSTKIVGNKLFIPKHLKDGIEIRVPKHYRLQKGCKTNKYTVSCDGDPTNPKTRYFVSVQAVCDRKGRFCKNKHAVGLDMGLESRCVGSRPNFITDKSMLKAEDLHKVLNLRFDKENEEKIKKTQSILSRKVDKAKRYHKSLHSRSIERQYAKLRKLQTKQRNQRLDFLHKLSTDIVKNNGYIFVEDLSVKSMQERKNGSKNRMAKAIANASWFEFQRMLEYKSTWYGRLFFKVDARNTSKVCSCCGEKTLQKFTLGTRDWTCEKCGERHDRDVNASYNILARGLSKLASDGTADYTDIVCGEGFSKTKFFRSAYMSKKLCR